MPWLFLSAMKISMASASVRGALSCAGQHTPAQDNAPRTLADAIEIFMADKKSQGITAGVLGHYERELARLRDFAERKGIFTAAGLSRELLIEYKADWEDIYP